jgi:hypothetical protein
MVAILQPQTNTMNSTTLTIFRFEDLGKGFNAKAQRRKEEKNF